MADIEQVGTKIQVEFVDYSEYTPGNIDPTKALENLESGETLAKSLGKAKRWIEVLQEGGGGGGGDSTIITAGEGIHIRGVGTFASPKIITNTGVYSITTPTAEDETEPGDKNGYVKIVNKTVSPQGVVSDSVTYAKPKGLDNAAYCDVAQSIPTSTPSAAEGAKLTTVDAIFMALRNKVDKTISINNKTLSEDVILDGADINLTGYSKAITETPILETDTINSAFGKIQRALDIRTKYGDIDASMPVNPTDKKMPSTKLLATELAKKVTAVKDTLALTDDNDHVPTSKLLKAIIAGLPIESDENVHQETTTQNNNFRVLLSNSANDSEEVAGVKKNADLKYNPFTGTLIARKYSGDGSTLVNIVNALNIINGSSQTEVHPLAGTSMIGIVAGDNVTIVPDIVHGTIRINAAGGGGGGGGGEDGRGIISIEKTSTSGLEDTYTIFYTDGTTSTYVVTNGADGQDGSQGPTGPQGPAGADGAQGPTGETGPQGPKGEDGADGRGIVSITKTGTLGLVDTYTITYTDGTTSTYTITNGKDGSGGGGGGGEDGRGIVSITKTDTEGLVDTYTILYTDGTTSTFSVTNGAQGPQGPKGEDGADGAQGPQGPKGEDGSDGEQGPEGPQGPKGDDGKGIKSVTKTSTSGLVDTYTITFTDDTTTTFTVTNGQNGTNGTDGQDGQDGAQGPEGPEGPQGPAGTNGTDGQDGEDGRGIVSITKTGTLGLVDTYTILYTDETTSTFSVTNGKDGEGGGGGGGGDGRGIVSITKTGTEGLVDTYSILYTDQTVSTFTVTNGANGTNGTDGQDGQDGEDGVGITGITKTGTAGLVDTYTISFSNGTSSTFTVTNGANGQDGQNGNDGQDGQDGEDGNGIVSITKTGTDGLVDTYTILFTNGTSTTFTITNGSPGQDGATGQQGPAGNDGVSITGVTKTSTADLVDTYTISYSNGTSDTFTVTNGADGQDGQDGTNGTNGRGITKIEKSGTVGLVDTYTITYTDSTTQTFNITNGADGATGQQGPSGNDGKGISSVTKTGTDGLVDTYTITFTDNTTQTFTVTNGADGNDGQDGEDGATGATGNGISSIAKTGTDGLVDTYTITYTNGNTDTFTITNGADGQDGTNGTNGTDGDDGVGIASIIKTDTTGLVDTYTITFTNNTSTTFTVTNGADGNDGATGATGNGISGIEKTGTAGLVDTYTITYTNGTSATFTVTNGANGTNGTNGTDGDDGRGITSIAKTSTAGLVDTYTITYTDNTTSTFTVTNGADGSSSDVVERYDKSYIHKEGNDIYFEASLEPGASYAFDCGAYTWVGAQPKDSSGANTRAEIGHTGATTSVTFTAASNETQVALRFFPGYDVATDDVDWSTISFTKTGDTPGTAAGKNAAKLDHMSGAVTPTTKETTNILSILNSASSTNPVQITLMGDSITNGYSADPKAEKSWAALFEAYIEDRYPYVTVVNTGVSGWKSADCVANLETAMPSGTTVAIAMFGTNDRQSAEHMGSLYNNYTTMYERAQTLGAKFIPMCCTAETLVNESISAKYVARMDDVQRIINRWAVDHNMEMINLYEGMLKYCNYDSDAFDLLFNQTETTSVDGTTYPFHIHPTNDGHYIMYRLICEALGCNAPVTQFSAPVGTGGGSPKYLHRIYLYRKGFYYLAFDLFTSSSTSFQGDTQAVFNSLAAEFTNQNFTSFSWRSIPLVTGFYRETSDGTAIPITAIYYDTNAGHFIGVREGVSTTTFTNSTIALTNMEEYSTSPKSSIFDNNIQTIGGGSGGSEPEEVVSEAFPCASGYENFSANSIVFKKGTVVTFAIILTIKSGTTCNPNTLIGTISSQFRPPSTNVLPGILAYESNADPAACGVNVNSDGTVRYYGISAGAGRHICINGSYLVSS